jgi:ribose/xylose/arabinose/galactoside ABC-type transport system permease subunit
MRDTNSVFLGVCAALVMGLIVGLINGIVIAKLRVNALITTLATMQIVRGLAYIFANGKAVGVSGILLRVRQRPTVRCTGADSDHHRLLPVLRLAAQLHHLWAQHHGHRR